MVVGFEPREFAFDIGANRIRRLASLKGDLQRILHVWLPVAVTIRVTNPQVTGWLQPKT